MGNARLVTVVGPAGVGKTRLVTEVAGRVASVREVWFVELAAIDSASAAETVASAVGAPDHAPSGVGGLPRPPEVRIVERLGNRAVVVFLDNCEHMLDAIAGIARRLLAECPELRIVATSREPLGIDGEHQFALGSLSDEDATTLFEARAKAVQPRFWAEHDGLVELCRHLDGLPLASNSPPPVPRRCPYRRSPRAGTTVCAARRPQTFSARAPTWTASGDRLEL
jgi:predicted ATPase